MIEVCVHFSFRKKFLQTLKNLVMIEEQSLTILLKFLMHLIRRNLLAVIQLLLSYLKAVGSELLKEQ